MSFLSQDAEITFRKNKTADELLNKSDPLTLVYKEVLEIAVSRGASDIHFEPKPEGIQVRIRVHGGLSHLKSIPKNSSKAFLSCLKKYAGLDISKAGIAQDARISLSSLKTDVRVNLIPTIDGEKVVFRLLDQNRDFNLEKIGFDEQTLKVLKEIVQKKCGLIIISGPTGSGKTTTLYSLLNQIDRDSLNVMSIEDPIEYRLSGLSQVGVNKKHGFSDALRAAMRQDPDVILVGEIRDQETAKLAVQASNTGHLVLSTLHANSASAVVERLKALEVEETSIIENLIFSGAQRLVQLLCPECRRPLNTSSDFVVKNEEGCLHCHRGVIGRKPILSFLGGSEISHQINQGLSLSGSSRSLTELALELAKQKEIDFNEVHYK